MNGLLDQERRYYYSAAWQLLQEEIDDDFAGSPGVDRLAQQFWGLRYIDDALMRRTDAGADGSFEESCFYITDSRYSPAALVDAGGRVVERVAFDPYGQPTHRWPGDIDGDGFVDSTDQALIGDAATGRGCARWTGRARPGPADPCRATLAAPATMPTVAERGRALRAHPRRT